MKRKYTIRLKPDEDKYLRYLYRLHGVPTDQFPERPRFWRRFTAEWNDATGRDDSPEEVLHYMVTRRKRPHNRSGRWEPLGDDHVQRDANREYIGKIDYDALNKAYVALSIASDNFAFSVEDRKKLSRKYTDLTGTAVQPLVLIAALVLHRKGGKLSTLEPQKRRRSRERDTGFDDLDQVG